MGWNTLASAGLILATVLVYGLVHSALASLWAKQSTRRWLGRLADRGYRLVYNLLAIVGFLPVFALLVLLPDHEIYAIRFPWLVLTLVIQALAVLALLAGLLQTGVWSFLGLKQLVHSPETEQPELVVSGLYRWVRHPLYTAGLVFIWLTPVMTTNLLALNIGLTLYILIGAMLEERKLCAEFGEPYGAYRRRTPMLVPWKLPARGGKKFKVTSSK
jgi:protein-S-isoprenylcysteine O-methyltransferase Ste14